MNWRAIAYAIPSAAVTTAAVAGISLLMSLVVPAIPGAADSVRNPFLSYPLFFAGIMTVPYILIFLPIALTVSFYRVFSSGSIGSALIVRIRFFAVLVAVGVFLSSSFWLVGIYIA